ncbi:hypothetical protein PV326_012079 [Microctonus aethiopoides]|nr:hypothetical protein PV326_012079 [Microctonus aethiopoides]
MLRVNEVQINKLELPTKCNMEITSKRFNDVAIQILTTRKCMHITAVFGDAAGDAAGAKDEKLGGPPGGLRIIPKILNNN